MLRGGRQSDWMSLPFPTSTPHPPTPHPPPSHKHQARILSSGLDGQVCSLRGYAVDGHAAGRGSARPSRSAAGRGLAAAEEGGGRLVAVLMRDGPFCARAPRACGVCGRARTRRGAGRCAPSSGGGRSSRGPGFGRIDPSRAPLHRSRADRGKVRFTNGRAACEWAPAPLARCRVATEIEGGVRGAGVQDQIPGSARPDRCA